MGLKLELSLGFRVRFSKSKGVNRSRCLDFEPVDFGNSSLPDLKDDLGVEEWLEAMQKRYKIIMKLIMERLKVKVGTMLINTSGNWHKCQLNVVRSSNIYPPTKIRVFHLV